jgi:hypothetical protein
MMDRVVVLSPSGSDGRQHIHPDATRRPCPSCAYSMISGKQLMPITQWSFVGLTVARKFSILSHALDISLSA